MSLQQAFASIFEGNPSAHYTWRPGFYTAVDHGITEDDIARHLRGEEPGLLSIPVLPSGLVHFAAGDCDRHFETDEPIDHAAVARKITELGLPLIITRSKSPKSGHVWIFFKEAAGFSAADARRLVEKYLAMLEISGATEIFPKQEVLEEGRKGSGINLPYFSNTRVAFGKEGEELDLAGFVELARARQVFGLILAKRDLADNPESEGPKERTDRPLPVEIIRSLHETNLKALRESNQAGRWNDTLNTTAFFCARAFAAKAMEGTEKEVKDTIRKAAAATDGWNERQMEATLESGWESGITQPLKILDPDKAQTEARTQTRRWLSGEMELSVEEVLSYLALVPEVEYETGDLRKQCSDKLQLKKSKLDEFVRHRRPKLIGKVGSNISFMSIDMWPHDVDGLVLLRELADAFRRFIFFKHRCDAEVMATWALGSHLYMEFNIFPRLGFTSPLPECGKTTCIDVMEHMVLRAIRADNISPSIAFRVMEDHHPSLLLDETDRFVRDNPELVGILNSGHKKDGFVWRTEKIDDRQVTTRFGCYGPLAYGMIGHPEGTLFSRTIYVRLERKDATQVVEDFDTEENPNLKDDMAVLRHKIVRWSADHRSHVRDCKPNTANLLNRNRNNWRPLLKIAEVSGGNWAGVMLGAAGEDVPITKKTDAEKLLRDIRNIFYTRKCDRLSSVTLREDLVLQSRSSWRRYHKQNDQIDLSELADLLNEFNIEPKPLRFARQASLPLDSKAVDEDRKKQRRGYTSEQLEPLFTRYLTGEPEEAELSDHPF